MIYSAGVEQLAIVAYIPGARAPRRICYFASAAAAHAISQERRVAASRCAMSGLLIELGESRTGIG